MKNFIYKTKCIGQFLLIFAIFMKGPLAYAQSKKQIPKRTFSVDSGYIPPLTTNRSMWNLQMEFNYLGTGLFDLGSDSFLGSNFLSRAIWTLGMEAVWFFVSVPVNTAQHELGHGARAVSIGGNPQYFWAGSSSFPSILPFMVQGILGFKSGLAYTSYSSSNRIRPTDYDFAVGMGGMNNSMMYAEHVEDEVYYNTGHILLYPSYLLGKLDTYNYSSNTRTGRSNGGDVSSIMSYWSAKGYGVNYSHLEAGSLLSLFGSATNLSFLWSIFKYIGTGDPTVHAPMIGSFKFPDFSSFQYRRGLSVRSRFGFGGGSDKTYYPISIEYVFKGAPAAEVSFGVRTLTPIAGVLKTGTLWQAYLCSAGGGGLRWSNDFVAGSSSFFTLGASLFNDQSLEGERIAGRFLGKNIGTEFWGKWTMAY
jgi:hypothetical protein